MIDTGYALWAIVVMALVTVVLRALPFLAAHWLRRFPIIERLGRFLPLLIMSLLVLDTLRAFRADNPSGPWQEMLAIAVAIGLQLGFRKPLPSILLATGLYMVLRAL